MFKPIKLIGLSLVLFLTYASPTTTFAISSSRLPITQSSEHWAVKIDQPDHIYSGSINSKPGVFNVFSLVVMSKDEKDLTNVKIEAFRVQPNSKTKAELFTADGYQDATRNKTIFHHHVFPVSIKCNEIEITITWSKKGESRKYKESFLFSL